MAEDATTHTLRLYLGDRVRAGQTDLDAFFTDDELAALLLEWDNNIYFATAAGWAMKAAEFAMLVDIDESGSRRRFSQMFTHALAQEQFYSKIAIDRALFTPAGPVTAKIYYYRDDTKPDRSIPSSSLSSGRIFATTATWRFASGMA